MLKAIDLFKEKSLLALSEEDKFNSVQFLNG